MSRVPIKPRRPEAYTGNNPYIFLSYSHKDADLMEEIVRCLRRNGYRVWYDDALVPGERWDANVARRLLSCSFFLPLITENYVASDNCYEEQKYAWRKKRPCILLYLEKETELVPEMEMHFQDYLHLRRWEYDSIESMLERAAMNPDFERCCDSDGKAEEKTTPTQAESAVSKVVREKPKLQAPKAEPVKPSSPVAHPTPAPKTAQEPAPSPVENSEGATFKDKNLRAYTGNQPYIFMSYSHRDSDAVEPILCALQTKYHVWYDEGIIPASEWAEVIAGHVKKCGCLLALISKNYLESDNCLDELEFARSLRRRRLLVFLEDIEFPPVLAMRHNRLQHIRKSRYNSAEELLGIIARAEGIERCVASETPNELASSPVEDFDFEASDDGVTITKYKGKGGAVVIPSEIGGKPVTRIGIGAFYDCTGLTSVTIPDSVTSIGIGAFANCASLRSIVVSKKNPAFIDIDGVLYNRERTALLAFPKGKETAAFIIPDSVTSIGRAAFDGCTGLTSVTIPDRVTSIGFAAFRGCIGLTSVTIPGSVTSIESEAFDDCRRLEDVYYGGSELQWKAIKIGEYNACLKSATIHYNTPKPTASP